jgi:hypothetical protein
MPLEITPQPITNPSTSNFAASGGGGFNVSGDASGVAKYLAHSQSIGGIWIRKWVFSDQPTYSSDGTGSGCPSVLYTYLDVNVTTNVTQEFVNQAFVTSGIVQNLHGVNFVSNSASGGWGTSGMFYTNPNGYIRRPALATDTEDTCTSNFNVIAGKQPGNYQESYDTSASLPGQFLLDVIQNGAKVYCPRFNTGLVDI